MKIEKRILDEVRKNRNYEEKNIHECNLTINMQDELIYLYRENINEFESLDEMIEYFIKEYFYFKFTKKL